MLENRLERLTPIAHSVAKERLLPDERKTLDEIGQMHGVSGEWVRLVQKELLRGIRETSENQSG